MERTITEIQEDLAATRAAINRVLLGVQSTHAADGREVRYADLAALQQRERELKAELDIAELRRGWRTAGRLRALEAVD